MGDALRALHSGQVLVRPLHPNGAADGGGRGGEEGEEEEEEEEGGGGKEC